jgi:hypothetical protein
VLALRHAPPPLLNSKIVLGADSGEQVSVVRRVVRLYRCIARRHVDQRSPMVA